MVDVRVVAGFTAPGLDAVLALAREHADAAAFIAASGPGKDPAQILEASRAWRVSHAKAADVLDDLLGTEGQKLLEVKPWEGA